MKYAEALDEEILPHITGQMNLRGKRNFLHVIAERQAKLQAQIDWICDRQEYYRRLRGN